MPTKVQPLHTPEEQELQRKQAELAALEAELAERELRLTTLQTRLNAFERRCMRIASVWIARVRGDCRVKPLLCYGDVIEAQGGHGLYATSFAMGRY